MFGKFLGITITDNMDWGQHISEIPSKASLRRSLAFAHRSNMEVAYKTLVRPKLEFAAPIWGPYSKLQIKSRGQRPAGPAGYGETRVVSSKCLKNLNGNLLRQVRMNQSCLLLYHKLHCRAVTSTRSLLTLRKLPGNYIIVLPDIQ